MSIRCVCPNGHVLNVKDSLAGASGLCPTCKVRIQVPHINKGKVSEEAILDYLGQWSPPPPSADISVEAAQSPNLSGIHQRGTPKKSCNKCNQEISSGTHICPHCHTYIANLDDF